MLFRILCIYLSVLFLTACKTTTDTTKNFFSSVSDKSFGNEYGAEIEIKSDKTFSESIPSTSFLSYANNPNQMSHLIKSGEPVCKVILRGVAWQTVDKLTFDSEGTEVLKYMYTNVVLVIDDASVSEADPYGSSNESLALQDCNLEYEKYLDDIHVNKEKILVKYSSDTIQFGTSEYKEKIKDADSSILKKLTTYTRK